MIPRISYGRYTEPAISKWRRNGADFTFFFIYYTQWLYQHFQARMMSFFAVCAWEVFETCGTALVCIP